MRNQGQHLPYRLFLRCQCCSSLAIVKFLQKTQFTFLEFSKHSRKTETQWIFQTTCRRCEKTNPAPNDLSTFEQSRNDISIDQVVRELSTECALVTLRDDWRYFFWTSGFSQDLEHKAGTHFGRADYSFQGTCNNESIESGNLLVSLRGLWCCSGFPKSIPYQV
jgi:hypothetical protein